mmetsp:Transcript_54347/g.97541  ORF Transcript_54347/g.97541 Transcript_54347/m.97541 type:complete len:91 (+) Transcript_54347:465-737(+)
MLSTTMICNQIPFATAAPGSSPPLKAAVFATTATAAGLATKAAEEICIDTLLEEEQDHDRNRQACHQMLKQATGTHTWEMKRSVQATLTS